MPAHWVMEGETLHILAEDEVSAEGSLFSELTADNSESSPVVEFNPLRGKKKKLSNSWICEGIQVFGMCVHARGHACECELCPLQLSHWGARVDPFSSN